MGPGADDATDSEHPPVFLPSSSSPENRCSIRKALRGSSVDSTRPQDSPRTPRKLVPKKSPKHGSSSKESSHSPLKSREKCCENDSSLTKENVNTDTLEVTKYSQSNNSRSPCKHCTHSPRNGPMVSPKHSKCPHGTNRHRKLPLNDGTGCTLGPSDEQWVDGPRFHKSKVIESQKIKEYELETWIDGPEATYGYMDDVKKSMIQKWVETQNSQSHIKDMQSKSPKHKPYKEMTQFKTTDQEETSPKHRDKHRDKRRSSDGRELRKDSNKLSASTKDSPHRRRSFNGPQQQQRGSAAHDSDKSPVAQAHSSEKLKPENASPSKHRHISTVPKEVSTSNSSPKHETQQVSVTAKETVVEPAEINISGIAHNAIVKEAITTDKLPAEDNKNNTQAIENPSKSMPLVEAVDVLPVSSTGESDTLYFIFQVTSRLNFHSNTWQILY